MRTETQVICDGCKRAHEGTDKPYNWYSRQDADGEQIACSRDCIDVIAKTTGKTRVILPW